MKYIRTVNAPIRGSFPETGGKINWRESGLDPVSVSRYGVQGDNKGEYISMFPIEDEVKAQVVVDGINNNADPLDNASIITEEAFKAERIVIESEKAEAKALQANR